MSYEGYTQYLCEKGHYWEQDCNHDDQFTCEDCGKPVAWANMVDVTNGSFDTNPETGREERIDGYIELETIETKTCDKCHSTLEQTFKIPEKSSHVDGEPRQGEV